MRTANLKKDWSINSSAFQTLLDWLDAGENSEGQRYLEIRERLVSYFERKDCRNPDELADETLNRVARRLEETGEIVSETPAKYCYITAKFVFLESLRNKEKLNVPLDPVLENKLLEVDSSETHVRENMFNCLEKCTDKLEDSNRKIIFGYYFGTERVKIDNRRSLAHDLNISVNALSIRACRIREKLQKCVTNCVAEC